ncbi:MAG: hypothetical protein HYX32_01895 [Actinobacteria bacterium]|nr:hypothetical protein [Actinomycetota bacterium]
MSTLEREGLLCRTKITNVATSARSCETHDLAVLHCLRSLSQFAEGSKIPKSIPWGGTKEAAWRKNGHVATFRFTSPEYRETFLEEATRLLPADPWSEVGSSDNDPAMRRR